jgi:hypothetical protein
MDIHLISAAEQSCFQLGWYRDGVIFEDNEIFIYKYSHRSNAKTYVAKKYSPGCGIDIFYFKGHHTAIILEEVKVYLTFI